MRKHILIVEDSMVIQNMIRQVLEFQHNGITHARNGTEALDLIQKHHYDVVLMDISMPLMDGLTCIKAIRKLPDAQKANIAVIAVSGNANGYTPREYANAGFNSFVQKPIDFDVLSQEIRNQIILNQASNS